MSSSSALWPRGDNKDLLISVANYLRDLLNENKSTLDEVSLDSLQIATESLQTIISPDDDELPPARFKLTSLYHSNTASPSKDGNNDDSKKRREKFLEFLKVLKKHDFFKGCDEGSSAFQERMEKARIQYNSRFPSMSIPSLDWLQSNEQKKNNQQEQKQNVVTESDKERAETFKKEGNTLLGQKKYNQAIAKYTKAIQLNANNAVYFSNRAAAHSYLKNYQQAVSDSRQASTIDPNYVKAYVREGLALYEMKDYKKAHDAYSKALNKTKSTDKNWETYMEKVELCQMKIDEANNANMNNDDDAMSGMPGMGGGGGPDLNSLLGGLGGGGLGGMDFSKIMQNPMMQQMAQQMMKDPNAMKKMGDMMKQFGGGQNMGNMAGQQQEQKEQQQVMADLLQNPEKAQKIFKEAMADPEVTELMQSDPSIQPLIDRIKTGDYAAFMELGTKPQAMAKVKSLIQKYYKK